MRRDVIFAISAQKVMTSSINWHMGRSVVIFRIRPHNTFPTMGQPLFSDKWFKNYRTFNFCRIFDDVIVKNADVSRKKRHFIIFCSEPIEDVLNLYRGKFGGTGPKNKKMTEGVQRTPQPTDQPKSPTLVGLNDIKPSWL